MIVKMISKFDKGDPQLALFALRLMFPVMLFHAVNYVMQGVLQTNGKFMLPAAVSIFSGLSIIIYIIFFAGRFGIRGLLIATFIGLAAQAASLLPPVILSLGYRYRPSLRLSDYDVRLAGRLALPVLVSSSSYQFNMFINSTFAARFDGGVLTITNMLTLAFTAAQLFIISTLSVFFPKMAARYSTGDNEGFLNSYNSVLRLIIIFAVPASAALAYVSRYLIPLLYGRGKVTEADMSISIIVFAVYACAIASIGFKEAADRAFYAIRDSRTPAAVSVAIMAINISLSLILMNIIGLAGLPVAYFIAITAGAIILMLTLGKRLPRIARQTPKTDNIPASARTNGEIPVLAQANGDITASARTNGGMPMLALKCAISSCAMLAAFIFADIALNISKGANGDIFSIFIYAGNHSAQYNLFRIAVPAAAGITAYAAAAYLLRVDEIRNLLSAFLRIFYKRRKSQSKFRFLQTRSRRD
jgi:murein biosynthesis integral membrane protein MurJ